jgi:polyhydroxyalkanoate synthesis regulator phasin
MAKAAKKSTTSRKKTTSRRTTRATRAKADASRADKSVQAFRDALDHSVTLSRDRVQEVVDDAVKRGRMTRKDANELVSSLVTRSRKYTDDLLKDLEKLLDQARKDVDSRTAPARRQVEKVADRAGRAARDAAEGPLAQADRIRRRARIGGAPITGYDTLTATQVKKRLRDLDKPSLRKVRTQEKNGKARKSVLTEVEKLLK